MHCFLKCSKLTDKKIFDKTVEIAKKYNSDIEHCFHNVDLSISLHEQIIHLIPHQASRIDLLIYASVLHDIGWIYGKSKHNIHSMELILQNPLEGLSPSDNMIVAQIARYHRKSIPKSKHISYTDIPEKSRFIVCYMAAILRIADGLDIAHDSATDIIKTDINTDEIILYIKSGINADIEISAAYKKSDLFIETYKHNLVIKQI